MDIYIYNNCVYIRSVNYLMNIYVLQLCFPLSAMRMMDVRALHSIQKAHGSTSETLILLSGSGIPVLHTN